MITQTELLKIARLSRLYVPEERLDALAADMSAIVAFADQIAAASADPAPLEAGVTLDMLRTDAVAAVGDGGAGSNRAAMLSNAATADGEFFRVEVRKRD